MATSTIEYIDPPAPGHPITMARLNGRELPLAVPLTPGVHRNWVPSCFFVIHDEHVHTTILFTPRQFWRDPNAKFRVVYRLFDGKEDPVEPAWTLEEGPIGLDALHRVTSERICAEMGVKKLFHYAEEAHHIEGFLPDSPNISLSADMHLGSDDGSVYGHLGSTLIFGAPRKMLKGKFYYENFPGTRLGDGYKVAVYIMNPFTRQNSFNVLLVDAKGNTIEGERVVMPGKSLARWDSDSLDLGKIRNPYGVVVRSDLKVNANYAQIGPDGKMISFDHGHPFLSQVLNHT